ncbi:MAG: DNA repair protein RadC [Eubacteriales bacterium]|nr:DNA repair protein RadC [Eubacteriales bacterium]
MDKGLHTGHRNRIKNRYRLNGLDSFEDHEVLELLLFYSIPMKDTNHLAHKMLSEYGSLASLFEADPVDIQKKCGVTENTALLVSLIPSLARRYFNRKWGTKPVLDSSYKAGKYSTTLFTGRVYEAFYAICLDSQNRVNYPVLVHKGTLNEAPVYPRLIVEAALRHQANSVILAHNHPGGSMQPSTADVDVTRKIKAALEVISVKVNDHIIVAGENYVSFAEKGLL